MIQLIARMFTFIGQCRGLLRLLSHPTHIGVQTRVYRRCLATVGARLGQPLINLYNHLFFVCHLLG